jgi:hypothetical protein
MQPTPMHLFVLATSLGFALAPAPARASGSVAVTVASAHHDLTIKQTFRKILARGQSQGYYASVRKDFLAISARLTPLLDRLLAGAARRQVRSLGRYDLPLPAAAKTEPTKMRKWLNLPTTYPALVQLPAITPGGGRLAYSVRLPLRRKPSDRELNWVFIRISRLISRHAGSEAEGKGQADRLQPVTEQSAQPKLVLTPNLWVARAQAPRLQGRVKALAAALRAKLEARLKGASGVTLAPFDPKLKYYGDSKRLPGLAAVSLWERQYQVVATYALKTIKDKAAVDALRRSLHETMAAEIAPSR